MFLKVLVVLLTDLFVIYSIRLENCSVDKNNSVVSIHQLDIHPSTISFPGEIIVNVDLTVNRRINHLFLDFVKEKKSLVWTTIPCIGSSERGSCNMDYCNVLSKFWNSEIPSGEFEFLTEEIISRTIGRNCPIDPDRYVLRDLKISLKKITNTVISTVVQGLHRITILAKDDPFSPDIGCVQFELDINTRPDINLIG